VQYVPNIHTHVCQICSLVDKLWTEGELEEAVCEQEVDQLPDDRKEELLAQIVVLLVTVNEKENDATRFYLKPLDGQAKILLFQELVWYGGHQKDYAIYHIGKYGCCPAAVRKIKPGSTVQGGASFVPSMAFNCFKNLGAIIGVGVACGVEKKAKMCDILISNKVTNYDKGRIQSTGALPRGENILASAYLCELFGMRMKWLSCEMQTRLADAGFKEMPKIKFGEILSGPYLIDDAAVKAKKIQSFAPEAVGIEMEAAYLFAATQGTMTNTIIVKAVCDFGDGHKTKEFQPTAAMLAAHCVHAYLDNPKVPSMLSAARGKSSMCFP